MPKGGKTAPPSPPAHAEKSKLYRMIAAKERVTTPFEGKLTRLTEAQIAVFRDWINQGAVWKGAATPASTKSLEDMEGSAPVRLRLGVGMRL